MKKIVLVAISAMIIPHVGAENRTSWLPDKSNTQNAIRLLECTYDKVLLQQCEEITSVSPNWEVSVAGDSEGHL